MKTVGKIFSSVVVAAALAAAATSASALVITPTTMPQWTYTGPPTGTSDVLAAFDAMVPGFDPALELYKRDVGQANDTGVLAGSYATVFVNTPADPSGATISYTGGNFLDCSIDCFLLVKDGNQNPAAYLFNLKNAWDGTETLTLQDFWPNQGAISHVAFYGGQTDRCTVNCTPQIPEPATLALVGLALLGAGAATRRKKAD